MNSRSLGELLTPALVLDRRRLEANIRRMNDRVRELGIHLRPHVKTPKSFEVLRLVSAPSATSIAVSTLREASYFLESGVADIFYAVPFSAAKMKPAADLLRRGAGLKIMTGSCDGASQIIDAARAEAIKIEVLVELDVDNYRTGAELTDPGFLQACRSLADSPHAVFAGILTYGGASYGAPSAAAMADLAEQHRQTSVAAVDMLANEGIETSLVSFGSSPATLFARTLQGFTETRCGIYMFQDIYQAGIGACSVDDIAVSVLVTVIDRQPRLNRFAIDAGGLALSKDRSTQGRSFDAGFGLVCDESGRIIPDLAVTSVSQELGLVSTLSGEPIDFASYPLGRRLRILPNHADMTAAAYESYHVVDGGDAIVAEWGRVNGW